MDWVTRDEIRRGLEWVRFVPGYGEGYAVTRCGRVLSFKGKETRCLSQNTTSRGYRIVGLYLNNKRKIMPVHRLVWLVFGDSPLVVGDAKVVVAHLDGDTSNNHINNLEQCSQKENMQHRHLHGTHLEGEGIRSSKLSNTAVAAAREAYSSRRDTLAGLARQHGVSVVTMKLALEGQTWSHVPGEVKVARAYGALCAKAKLTQDRADEIRALYESGGTTYRGLAKQFGVSPATVGAIVRGDRWQPLPKGP